VLVDDDQEPDAADFFFYGRGGPLTEWQAFSDRGLEPNNGLRIGAVPRSWEDRFGARLLWIGPRAEIRLLVDRPPRTFEAAAQVAKIRQL
jgi:hypothetical protein